MITFVRGGLVDKQPTRIVVDVGGVGYEVLIPLSSYERLPASSAQVHILTVDHVREDSHQLFGFMTEAERSLFGLLLGISGIGPKLALGVLSGMSVRDFKAAVSEGDTKRIHSISGIGAKTADRIVVELRHKLSDADVLEALHGSDDAVADVGLQDAVMALIALGYKQEDARKMVMRVSKSHPEASRVEDMVRLALSR